MLNVTETNGSHCGGAGADLVGSGADEPPLREDRIARARRLVDQGYFDRPEIIDRAIEKLLDELACCSEPRKYSTRKPGTPRWP